MTDFLKKAIEKGRVRQVEEAFIENPVEDENHKGKLEKERIEKYKEKYMLL